MKLTPNPQYEVFLAELKRSKRCFAKWRGIAFRAAPLEFAHLAKLLDGRGALKFGGRWSAAGIVRAVNLSLSQEAAVKESTASFAYYNFAPEDVRPKILVGIRVNLESVIDLINPRGIGKKPWLWLEELVAEDWRKLNDAGKESQSQAFGRAAYDAGAEGLLTPSARVAGGVNLVFFPEAMRSRSKTDVLGQAELERWLKKG